MRSIINQPVAQKKVLLRVDFNLPMNEKGEILDFRRMDASLPTIKFLLDRQAKVILISHLGRPQGKVVEGLKLKQIASALARRLGVRQEVDLIQLDSFSAYKISPALYLLENIRFYPQEEKNDFRFARSLANLGELFVNDAFSCSHRAHASISAITRFLPSCAGLALQKEVRMLSQISRHPRKPLVCLLGGAKVQDKIQILTALKKADWFLLGGVLANTFLFALGEEVADSKVAQEEVEKAQEIYRQLKEKIVLPQKPVFGWLEGKRAILDISKEDVQHFASYIQKAQTIFWNGTFGLAEDKRYQKGSLAIAHQVIRSKALSVVGGGDTVALLDRVGLASRFGFVSLGGGAMLDFLTNQPMPGLQSLNSSC